MTITEFTIDLNARDADYTNEHGIGTLIITDAALLVRPRRDPNQYPSSVKHDADHAYQVLSLCDGPGAYDCHILYKGGVQSAHGLLDRVFYAYLDACCFSLWCDARVYYFAGNNFARVEEYGFEDGHYSMVFNVYCDVGDDQAEELLGILAADEKDRFVVVRPEQSERGFTAHGFVVDQPTEDELARRWRMSLFGR